ncbi:MAG: SusE domain-containing protein, partial [Alistipes sp.]|nr:SusE domain-containing protein [Alistipes sp.]
MRKLLNIAILALAGAALSSCEQEHIDAQYLPEKVVAPVLGNIAGGELIDGGEGVTIDYTVADYGMPTAVSYTLFVDLDGNDFAAKQKVASTISGGKINVTAKDMNTAII